MKNDNQLLILYTFIVFFMIIYLFVIKHKDIEKCFKIDFLDINTNISNKLVNFI